MPDILDRKFTSENRQTTTATTTTKNRKRTHKENGRDFDFCSKHDVADGSERRAGVSFAYNRNIRIAVDGWRAPVSLESFMLHTTRATEFPIGYLLHIYVHAGTHHTSNSVRKSVRQRNGNELECTRQMRVRRTTAQDTQPYMRRHHAPPPLPPANRKSTKKAKTNKMWKTAST